MRFRAFGVRVFVFLTLVSVASLAAPLAVKTIAVKGAKIPYVEAGAGEPIVFVHGADSDYRVWDAQMAALSAKYHVIAVSLRYHLGYEWPKKVKSTADYNVAQHATDVADVIQGLRLGPVVLVGHSYGGDVATRVAMAHPELVRSLVLAEPFVPELLPATEQGQAIRASLQEGKQMVLSAAASGDDEKTVRAFADIALDAGSFDKLPEMAQIVMLDNARTIPLLMNTGLPAQPDYGCTNVGAIKSKTLLVSAEKSPAFYHLMASEFARCLPGAQQVTIPGVGHYVEMEAPDAFTAALTKFLTSN